MKKLFTYTDRLKTALRALAFCAAALLAGCSDDDESLGIYAYLDAESTALEFDVVGGEQEYLFYSNLPEWQIYVDYYTERDTWVDVFESKGKGDGRFTVAVEPNSEQAFERQAQVQIVSGGQVYATVDVSQKAASPYIRLDMHGMDEIYAGNRGATRVIKLDTNVPFTVQADEEWISAGENDGTNQELIIAPNSADGERQARVKFVMVGTGNETVNTEILVTQTGNEMDIDFATASTVADVLAAFSPGSIINSNIYVDAYVISDYSTCNFEDNVMIVQEGDKGLWIEFADEDENTIETGTKLRIHLTGYPIVLESSTGRTKIVGFSGSESIISSEKTSGIEPIVLDDTRDIENYENVLVKLPAVEFAVPVGTYVNSSEIEYQTPGNATSLAEADTPMESCHILRDAQGRTARLYSSYRFTDKFVRLMPKGSGPVTGIAVRRIRGTAVETVLRLRSDRDNGVSDDPATALTREIVRFGPWSSLDRMTTIYPDAGTGNFKNSRTGTVDASSSDQRMYWSWSFSRVAPATGIGNFYMGIPGMVNKVELQNVSLNCQTWWNATGSSITDASGKAWIITTSTAGTSNPLLLSFLTSSSQTGPKFLAIEYAEDESAPLSQWTHIADYTAQDWNSNYQLIQYHFELPAELIDRDRIVIRMRVTENKQARNENAIATGGTNRIGYWAIHELKN
ncbi:MAG: DUF5689 domain-containing protein [Rikenellaceae bacterium]|nr:DUF5689 domain-containing protein [Rikenellaceae bacterium]